MERLSDNLEGYLKAILELQQKNSVARVKDIACKVGVLCGTVTSALRSLSEKKLINYKPYSFITLTLEGKKIAEEVSRRHNIIKDFLHCVLLLDEKMADMNACRMAHAMDRCAVNRLVQFIGYVYNCPRTGEDWIGNFITFFSQHKIASENCPECLKKCVERHSDKEFADSTLST